MDVSPQTRRDSKLGSICEAATLISITLMLIGLYLYFSGARSVGWPILFATLSGVGIIGCVVASYRQISETESEEENTEFRITFQLVETLKAKKMFDDVIYGLEGLVKQHGDYPIKGKRDFLRLLEETLGWERTKEVDGVIIKYAQVRNGTT